MRSRHRNIWRIKYVDQAIYLYNVKVYTRNVMDAQHVCIQETVDLMVIWLHTWLQTPTFWWWCLHWGLRTCDCLGDKDMRGNRSFQCSHGLSLYFVAPGCDWKKHQKRVKWNLCACNLAIWNPCLLGCFINHGPFVIRVGEARHRPLQLGDHIILRLELWSKLSQSLWVPSKMPEVCTFFHFTQQDLPIFGTFWLQNFWFSSTAILLYILSLNPLSPADPWSWQSTRRLTSSSISLVVHVVWGVEQWPDVAFPLPLGRWAAGSTMPVVEWWDWVDLPKEDKDEWLPVWAMMQ